MSDFIRFIRRWEIAAGLLVLMAALLLAAFTQLRQVNSVRAAGSVVGLVDRTCVGSTCSCAVVEFVTTAGKPQRFDSSYCRRANEYFDRGQYWPGAKVAVLYDPQAPTSAKLDNPYLLYQESRGLAIVAVAWLLLAIPRARRRPPPRRGFARAG